MNYTNIYFRLIIKVKKRNTIYNKLFYEYHHIIPKSINLDFKKDI